MKEKDKYYGRPVSVRMYDDLIKAIERAIDKRGDEKIKTASAYIKRAVLKELAKDGFEI